MANAPFRDRHQAGQHLAQALRSYANRDDVVVLALPRGGVPVAFEVARALGAPLDVFLVRKLGAPGHPEFAIGAIATGGVRVLSKDAISSLGISSAMVDEIVAREQTELERRDKAYHGDRAKASLRGKTVIVIDDGLATGSTMEAAVRALREHHAAKVIAAAPVGAVDNCVRLRTLADEVICLETPEPFQAVGRWYRAFDQTTDAEVVELLLRRAGSRQTSTRRIGTETEIDRVRAGAIALNDDAHAYDALIKTRAHTRPVPTHDRRAPFSWRNVALVGREAAPSAGATPSRPASSRHGSTDDSFWQPARSAKPPAIMSGAWRAAPWPPRVLSDQSAWPGACESRCAVPAGGLPSGRRPSRRRPGPRE